MGSICDSDKEFEISNDYEGSKFDPKVLNQRFQDYIFKDKIIDSIGNKYKLNDSVFLSIHKEESNILNNFYFSKKDDFKNNINKYLNSQNINFINLLTKQIISNEGGSKFLEKKIKNEIINISNKPELFKIKYLTIMIIGITGTGKSTLVNNLLFNGEKIAPEIVGKIGNQEPTTSHQNKKDVPYLRLIDTRGIELVKAWSVNT